MTDEQARQLYELRIQAYKNMPTLRDQFAMAALTGLLADRTKDSADKFACAAYRVADAMVLERACRDNPDLPRDFVKNTLLAMEDVEKGNVTPYEFGGNEEVQS